MALGSQIFNYRDRFWLAVTGPVLIPWGLAWGSRSGGGFQEPLFVWPLAVAVTAALG
jgi:hypothetical protein